MEKNERRKNSNNPNKRLVSAFTLIVALITITLCILITVGATQPVQSHTNPYSLYTSLSDHKVLNDHRAITWDVQMNFSETGGKTDTAYFGEAPDANDGPPADVYDTVKPPAPIPSYIRAWFSDNLPAPYDVLWKDYRDYPGINKTWILSVLWYPSDYVSPTNVIISWNTVKVNNSEYDKVVLTNSTGFVLVQNMFTTGSYTYSCPAMIPKTFKINGNVDNRPPQIINHSPGTGETGDTYSFNASVFDDMTTTSSLIVKVNWVHGSFSGNDTMTNVGGNYFVKTITLSNYSANDLTYHFYAKDKAKVPNINYTTQYSATVSDDEAPVITGDSGPVSVGTGDSVTLWVQGTDNIAVTSVKATIDSVDHAMAWNAGNSRWQYVYTAPSGSTASHSYNVTVYDAAANSDVNGLYTITVNDNDPPVITNVIATPSSQLGNGHVNITATITDNINLLEKKVRITGPTGYTPVNISLTHDSENTYYYNSTYAIPGFYNYSIWAKDINNNGATSTVYQFNIYTKLIITTVLAGWNFVSLPFNQTITKTHLFILYLGTEYNWSNAVSSGLVLDTIFDWDRSGQGYLLSSTLAPGRGYWIYAYYQCEIWATILNPIVTNSYITPLSYRWNIIGVPVNEPVNKTSLIVNYNGVDYNWTQATTNQNPTNGPLVINNLFGWKRTPSQGYIISDTLEPGYSYWMYAFFPCTLKRQL